MYGQDPAKLLESEQERGARCYDCLHHQQIGVGCRGQCEKKIRGYPKEGRSTCIHFIYANPANEQESSPCLPGLNIAPSRHI